MRAGSFGRKRGRGGGCCSEDEDGGGEEEEGGCVEDGGVGVAMVGGESWMVEDSCRVLSVSGVGQSACVIGVSWKIVLGRRLENNLRSSRFHLQGAADFPQMPHRPSRLVDTAP